MTCEKARSEEPTHCTCDRSNCMVCCRHCKHKTIPASNYPATAGFITTNEYCCKCGSVFFSNTVSSLPLATTGTWTTAGNWATTSTVVPVFAQSPTPSAESVTDTERMNWLEKHPRIEVTMNWEPEEAPWIVHHVSGGVNDREWEEIATGNTFREAVDNARKALEK